MSGSCRWLLADFRRCPEPETVPGSQVCAEHVLEAMRTAAGLLPGVTGQRPATIPPDPPTFDI